jgi:hypothetical protein
LCEVAGLSAIGGGAAFMWRPDGSLMHLPLSLLRDTPFDDFFVPGLLLAGVVGAINAAAGVLVLRGHPNANRASFFGGLVLTTWVLAEVLLLRKLLGLHVACLVVALGIQTLAVLRDMRAGKLTPRAVAT